MSFLTDDDVNKRENNLIVAFEPPTTTTTQLRHRFLNEIQFYNVYSAFVPGLGRYNTDVGSGSGANVTTNTVGEQTDVFFDQTIGLAGTTLGQGTTPFGADTCWECEVIVAPGNQGILQVGCGAILQGVGFPPYDADAYAGSRRTPGNEPLLFTSTAIGSELVCFADTIAGLPPLAAGDVVGFVLDDGTSNVWVFVNGVQVPGTPVQMDPLNTFSSVPWLTLEFNP